jgi:hypothetical protein
MCISACRIVQEWAAEELMLLLDRHPQNIDFRRSRSGAPNVRPAQIWLLVGGLKGGCERATWILSRRRIETEEERIIPRVGPEQWGLMGIRERAQR